MNGNQFSVFYTIVCIYLKIVPTDDVKEKKLVHLREPIATIRSHRCSMDDNLRNFSLMKKISDFYRPRWIRGKSGTQASSNAGKSRKADHVK